MPNQSKLKTYEVVIRAVVTKTITVQAENREEAIEEANEKFTVVTECGVPESYEDEVLDVEEMPESPPPPVYSHMFALAFTVVSENDGEHCTDKELIDALQGRIADIIANGEVQEACGTAEDSQVVEPK